MSDINKSEKAKGILAKIAQLFVTTEPILEHKLADGTVLKMDKMEAGGKVTIGDKAAEAKIYVLPSGTKIICDAAGLITEVIELKLMEYKLADGTTINADKLEVGGAVTKGGMPAAAGEYKLEDGSSITVDATGVIIAVKAKEAAAVPATPDMSTPEGMRAAYDKFAVGTPEERLANAEVLLKALMEYSFGWQLREVSEKASRDAAMKVYQDTLNTAVAPVPVVVEQARQQGVMLKQMFELMTEVLNIPTGEVPGAAGKKKFSFADVEGRKKTFGRFQEAAKKLHEQWKEMEKIA